MLETKEHEMIRAKRALPAVLVLILSFFIISCGSSEETQNSTPAPNPAPATAPVAPISNQPTAPTAPAPTGGLGGSLEAQSPGTPIGNDQASWNALNQRLATNMRFYGNVTVSSVLAWDYTIQNGTFQKSNQQTLPNQTPTLEIYAQGDVVYLSSPYEGTRQFSFQPQVSIFGVILKSTDSVGLYLTNGGLLKINYNVKNPAIEYYQFQQYGPQQVRVTQKIINTAGVIYPQ